MVKYHESCAFDLGSSGSVRDLSERGFCKEGGDACVMLMACILELMTCLNCTGNDERSRAPVLTPSPPPPPPPPPTHTHTRYHSVVGGKSLCRSCMIIVRRGTCPSRDLRIPSVQLRSRSSTLRSSPTIRIISPLSRPRLWSDVNVAQTYKRKHKYKHLYIYIYDC